MRRLQQEQSQSQSQQRPIAAADPEPEPEPHAWAFTTKKSKKDKKKKRKSIPGSFGDEEESGTATPATPMEVEQEYPQVVAAEGIVTDDNPRSVDDIVMTDEPANVGEVRPEPMAEAREEQHLTSQQEPALAAGDGWGSTP